MKTHHTIFLSLMVIILFGACNRDNIQAENSIEGEWNIVKIESMYGELFPNGSFNPSQTVSESGDLGTFTFGEDTANYEFTRNDTLYTGNGNWEITSEKVREGFFRVREFTLTIENHFLFEVAFEDETKNAEKNAKNTMFIQQPTTESNVMIIMELEKR